MINVVMIARDRRQLTTQAIGSIIDNTKDDFTLTVVDDGSQFPLHVTRDKSCVLRVENSNHNLGALKNLGVYWSERRFGRGDWLAILDNDVCFIDPKWMDRVGKLINKCRGQKVAIVGGYRHPFHGANKTFKALVGPEAFEITDAVAGYSHFMEWDTWNNIGPYVETGGPGVNQSEDWALCRKAVECGLLVGYIDPPVLVHTGITNSEGKPAVGSEHFLRVPGVLYL